MPDRAFIFHVTEAGKTYLLREGIEIQYSARHLKRAIERLLVHPLSNLIATDQIRNGDWIRVDFSADAGQLIFLKEAEGLPIRTMAELVDTSVTLPADAFATGAKFEPASSRPTRAFHAAVRRTSTLRRIQPGRRHATTTH